MEPLSEWLAVSDTSFGLYRTRVKCDRRHPQKRRTQTALVHQHRYSSIRNHLDAVIIVINSASLMRSSRFCVAVFDSFITSTCCLSGA